jgi:hypothetical protein
MPGSRRTWLGFAAVIAGAALMTGAACAQTPAPAKPLAGKAPKKATASVTIIVTNSRAVALTELDATPTGQFIPKRVISSLAPGAKTSAVIATDKDCVFDLRGMYFDTSVTELPAVDLCKDHNVNLVD